MLRRSYKSEFCTVLTNMYKGITQAILRHRCGTDSKMCTKYGTKRFSKKLNLLV